MKYRFPNIDIVQRQLLSCVYQEEEFQYLYVHEFSKVKSFLKKSKEDKFTLREIKEYNSEGYLVSQEVISPENDKKEIRRFEYETNRITAEYEDQIITWEFNLEGILIKEIHNFNFDGPTVYNFELDEKGNLIKINKIRFDKSNGITNSIISEETKEHLYDGIQFNEQANSIKFGNGTHENILKIDNIGRVIKRINKYRIVETVYIDSENWKSYMSIEGKPKYLKYKRESEVEANRKTTIGTSYTASGEIEYEFKEVYTMNE
jgi:hypothetical protein